MSAYSDFKQIVGKLPPFQRNLVTGAISIVLGLLAALVLDYILYRVGLPSKPFIYVAF